MSLQRIERKQCDICKTLLPENWRAQGATFRYRVKLYSWNMQQDAQNREYDVLCGECHSALKQAIDGLLKREVTE